MTIGPACRQSIM